MRYFVTMELFHYSQLLFRRKAERRGRIEEFLSKLFFHWIDGSKYACHVSQCIPNAQVFTIIRMIISILVLMISFSVTAALVLIDTKQWTEEFFIITMVILVVISAFGAALQGALFGMAGMFPSRYIQAVMAGQGLGGYFVCAVNILSSVVDESNIMDSSFAYFCTGTFAMFVSLFAYIYLEKLPIVKYYTRKTSGMCVCTCNCTGECHLEKTEDDNKINENINKEINYRKITKKIGSMMATVYITFFITLSVFPSLTARIKSTWQADNKWTESLFVSVGCFLTYNLFDYIGKSLPGIIQKPNSSHPRYLVTLALSRVVFIPLFALCNVQPRINESHVLFEHDAIPILIMALFALSGGYVGSLPFIYAPVMVEQYEQEVATTLVIFSLVGGLASGAAFSFVISPNF